MSTFEEELKRLFPGEVYFDSLTRSIYSVDASIFEILPTAVVKPKTLQELQIACEVARRHRIPVIARGAATGITGGCIGKGLIIDLSKYFTKIVSVDLQKQTVSCEPGVVQDDLNRFLEPYGFRLGPDTSTGNRATLGGMLANNAAGAHSLLYGKMSDHIVSLTLLLSTGEIVTCGDTPVTPSEKKIYRAIEKIRDDYKEAIIAHFPTIPRRVSGYNLDLLLSEKMNLAKLIAGSEGTLGIVTQMTLKIVPKMRETGLLLFDFPSLPEAFSFASSLLAFSPASLELIDEKILKAGKAAPYLKNKLDWLDEKGHLLAFELEAEDEETVLKKLQAVQKQVGQGRILKSKEECAHLWSLRKAGLGLLLSKRSYNRAIAFIEDLSLPPDRLGSFMKSFLTYLKVQNKEAGIYGHAGSGCIHIRPYFDLRNEEEKKQVLQIMEDVSALVLEHGGALSGEHGDGWIRSWLNPKMFGPQIMEAFQKVKSIFDPEGLMNPGKIIPSPLPPFDSLRTSVNEHLLDFKTFLDFEKEGGFPLSVDLCNGNGACRKMEGIMCPSFQATKDEFHSTRARAEALRAIIHKEVSPDSLLTEPVQEVLDLCLSCKGCKTECPSQVDMAKIKSELLYHYQKEKGISLRSRLFASIGDLYKLAFPFRSLFNWMINTGVFKALLSTIGLSKKRKLPQLASYRFSSWFSSYLQKGEFHSTVRLLNDTFTEFLRPEIGESATIVLNHLGYFVELIPWKCCGRPAFSKGLLEKAHSQATSLIDIIEEEEVSSPIIGLEPSCLFTFKDDYPSLLKGASLEKFQKILPFLTTLDEFLSKESQKHSWRALFSPSEHVLVHGHCYQKSLIGMSPTIEALGLLPGIKIEEIPSGCCGMAGSFGYEKEHEALSSKIGELVLFPAIRQNSQATIIANGTSCREQIHAHLDCSPLHLAEFLKKQLKN